MNVPADIQNELARRMAIRAIGGEHVDVAPKAKLTLVAAAGAYAQTPAGRKHLRGFPVAENGGLDERRDPLLELIARERSKLKGKALKAYDAIDAR